MHIYRYTCIYTDTQIFICIYRYIDLCIYVYTHIYIYTYTYTYRYSYKYMYTYLSTHAYICHRGWRARATACTRAGAHVPGTHYQKLQCVSVCCSMLQCVAVCGRSISNLQVGIPKSQLAAKSIVWNNCRASFSEFSDRAMSRGATSLYALSLRAKTHAPLDIRTLWWKFLKSALQ